ncbi:MAG: PAS domain S-box protein [Deltaproteobacteria bacterium]|nr:PAS domain S-box protein [Deltaproteobacteria bacterium]
MNSKPTYEEPQRRIQALEKKVEERDRMERELREGERRIRALFDQTYQFIGLLSPEGILLEANRTALEFSGVQASDVLGKPFWETPWWNHSPDMQERLREAVQAAARGEFIRFEARHPAPDGIMRLIDFSLKPVKDETGRVTLLIPEGRDITHLKEAEDALRESEERYRDLFENANDLIQAVAPDGRFLYVNRAWRETLGYGEEEVERLSVFDIIHPDSRAHCREVFRQVLGGEKVESFEAAFLAKKGGKILLEGNLNCRFVEGRPVSTRAIFRDITERKEIEEALKISEERFRTIAASAQDAIVSVDNDGRISYWNPSAARIFGYQEKEALGRDIHDLLAPEKYHTQCQQGFDRWRSTGKGPVIGSVRELTALRRDGSEIPIELSLSSVRIRGAWNAIGLVRDITKRKRAEAELEKRTRDLDMRVKQLYCLYGISGLLEKQGLALGEILGGIVDLIPPAWQYPESTCARIELEGEEYRSAHFTETAWQLARNITVEGRDAGKIQVFYREERPEAYEGPFLREERTLLNVVTERVGKIIERKRSEEALARAREMEIEIGARIQKALLLGTPPGDLAGMRIAALTIPSRGIDGDFYDFFRHTDRCVDVIVGDVMGKGIPAALLGAGTKSRFLRALTHLVFSVDHLPDPEEIVQSVHGEMVRELIDLESFVTLCYARFDLDRGMVDLVDCGHTKTVHFHASSGQVSTIGGDNVPLGIIEEEVYRQVSEKVGAGDALFFYSDGVTEAQDDRGEFFGEERLFDCVRSHARLDPESLVEGVRKAVGIFSGSETFSDDLTCVAVRIDGGGLG